MTREDLLAKLAAVRVLARTVQEATDNPSVERCMTMVDMYCHLAQWNLGADVEIVPDIELIAASNQPPAVSAYQKAES